MSFRIRLTKLTIIIQPIWPNMATPTIQPRIRSIHTLQKPRRRRPIAPVTPIEKRRRLSDSQRMRDFVQGRAFVHVGAIRAEADVAVVVGFGRWDAWGVAYAEGFGDAGVVGCPAGEGGGYCIGYAGVGVGFVGRGSGVAVHEGPGYGCGGEWEEGGCEGEDEE